MELKSIHIGLHEMFDISLDMKSKFDKSKLIFVTQDNLALYLCHNGLLPNCAQKTGT